MAGVQESAVDHVKIIGILPGPRLERRQPGTAEQIRLVVSAAVPVAGHALYLCADPQPFLCRSEPAPLDSSASRLTCFTDGDQLQQGRQDRIALAPAMQLGSKPVGLPLQR